MLKSPQISLDGERLHRFPFPGGVVPFNTVKHAGGQDKKTTIDPVPVGLRLLAKCCNHIAAPFEHSESLAGLYGGERRQFPMTFVESHQRRNIHVAYAVSISHAEIFTPNEVRRNALQAPAGHCVFTRIHQGYLPWFGALSVHFHPIFSHMECDVGGMEEVIREEFLDQIAFVSKADYEVVDTVLAIYLEDVPEYGPAPDFDHRFRPHRGLFADSRSKAASQNDCFHCK